MLRWGEFELDRTCYELRRSGLAVALQPKAFDLLCYLAEHRERVVAKEELLEQVWKAVAVTDASLNQAVSLARRATGDSRHLQHTVRTIRSRGFRFVAAVDVVDDAPLSGTPCRRIAQLIRDHTEHACHDPLCLVALARLDRHALGRSFFVERAGGQERARTPASGSCSQAPGERRFSTGRH